MNNNEVTKKGQVQRANSSHSSIFAEAHEHGSCFVRADVVAWMPEVLHGLAWLSVVRWEFMDVDCRVNVLLGGLGKILYGAL